MAFDFNRLIPNAAKKKREQRFNNLLYIVLVEWGWDYETFLKTPIPILNRCFQVHNEKIKQQNKNSKKKR